MSGASGRKWTGLICGMRIVWVARISSVNAGVVAPGSSRARLAPGRPPPEPAPSVSEPAEAPTDAGSAPSQAEFDAVPAGPAAGAGARLVSISTGSFSNGRAAACASEPTGPAPEPVDRASEPPDCPGPAAGAESR